MSVVLGNKSELWVQTGTAQAFANEACSLISGTTYQITSTTKRQWDPETTPAVYVGGVLQTSGYRIQGAVGRIIFGEAPGAAVTVTGKYYATVRVARCGKWKLALKTGVAKTSGMGDGPRTFVGLGLLSWGGSFEKIEDDNIYAGWAKDNSTPIIAKFYETTTDPRVWIGYILPENWEVEAPDEDLLKESLDFTGTLHLSYLESES
jgi:hypothetical protein